MHRIYITDNISQSEQVKIVPEESEKNKIKNSKLTMKYFVVLQVNDCKNLIRRKIFRHRRYLAPTFFFVFFFEIEVHLFTNLFLLVVEVET